MPESFRDSDFPARPYPGARPDCSFVHLDGIGHPLDPTDDGLRVEGIDLDEWLRDEGAPPMRERTPVLAYGSNACPAKITWLRDELGLRGPVVMLRVTTTGIAAVWAAGFRIVDEQRPATLAASPGTVEKHAVWLATPEQIAVLDRCEGRGERYDLARLHTGAVSTETGAELSDVHAYVGRAAIRRPLLMNGEMVRCADVSQAEARGMAGVPAATDGLTRTVLAPPFS